MGFAQSLIDEISYKKKKKKKKTIIQRGIPIETLKGMKCSDISKIYKLYKNERR